MSRTGPRPEPAAKNPDDLTVPEALFEKARTTWEELRQLGAGPEWTLERVVEAKVAYHRGEGPKLDWVVKAVEGEAGRLAVHFYHGDEFIVRGRSFR